MLAGLGSFRLQSYDPLGRLTTLIEQKSSAQPISTMVDSWDGAGRKTSSLRNGVIATYTNDAAGRLSGQQKPNQVSTFSYDATDNVLVKWYQAKPPLTMMYDAANRLLIKNYAAATTNVTYDKCGNLTTENQAGAITGFVYDSENRLVKQTEPDGTVMTMSYQGDGLRRTRQKHGEQVSTFVWDGSDYLQERKL